MRVALLLMFVMFGSAAPSQAQNLGSEYLSPQYVAPLDAPSDIFVAGEDEPGERLVVTGQALDGTTPVAGVSVYVFHTDADGLYATDGSKGELNPRLYGALRTDANGRYRYETIRPAGYSIMPAHVHYVVTAPGYMPRMFDLWFEDDPLLAERRAAGQPEVPPRLQGDYLAIMPVTRDASGVWHVAAHDLQILKE